MNGKDGGKKIPGGKSKEKKSFEGRKMGLRRRLEFSSLLPSFAPSYHYDEVIKERRDAQKRIQKKIQGQKEEVERKWRRKGKESGEERNGEKKKGRD